MKKIGKIRNNECIGKDCMGEFYYDPEKAFEWLGGKWVLVTWIKDNSTSNIPFDIIVDIKTNESNDDIFEGHTPYFGVVNEDQVTVQDCENGFDYRGAYLQQKEVNDELRENVKNLQLLLKEYAIEVDKLEDREKELQETIELNKKRVHTLLNIVGGGLDFDLDFLMMKYLSMSKDDIDKLNGETIKKTLDDHEERLKKLESRSEHHCSCGGNCKCKKNNKSFSTTISSLAGTDLKYVIK